MSWARNGFGRVGRAPVPPEKRYRIFDLLASGATVPATENPRVAGSIPALATIPTSMNRKRFPPSLADYHLPRGQKTTNHRTSGFRVGCAGR